MHWNTWRRVWSKTKPTKPPDDFLAPRAITPADRTAFKPEGFLWPAANSIGIWVCTARLNHELSSHSIHEPQGLETNWRTGIGNRRECLKWSAASRNSGLLG